MRLYALLAVGIMLVSGCSFAGDDPSDIIPAAVQPEAQTVHYDERLGKYVPAVNLYTVGVINPDMSFKEGESLKSNVHTRWAEERLGIRIRYLWTLPGSSEIYANKLRLELAKGNMPDIVTTRDREVIQELIDSGQFREAGSLFQRYASPAWKAAMDEEPAVWNSLERDGQQYAIPILDYEYNSDPVLWIRADWLKKLKLPVPETLDELETVMDAFANGDPDGNGLKDTFGLSVSFRNGASTWMGDASWIFGAFGTVPEQWNTQPDGTLQYGSVMPAAGQALALMKSWVDKGYLSKDNAWQDEEGAAALFTSGKAGIIAGPFWMRGWPLTKLADLDPEAVIQAVPLPSGPDGRVQRRGLLPVNGAILINKKMEHPEIFFTYQNYLFDYYATSSGEFANGLAKGYDWTEQDGETVTDPTLLPQGGIRVESYTLTFDGARIPSRVIKEIPQDIAPVLLSQLDASLQDQFTGPPTRTMRTSWELLQKLEQKTFEQIIFGDLSVSEFPAFVTKWSQYGGEQVTREVGEWYLAQP